MVGNKINTETEKDAEESMELIERIIKKAEKISSL
tara:strand:- start:657 stop:761 length:105 start_codon:yes stop_codon:yes gene_type:complete